MSIRGQDIVVASHNEEAPAARRRPATRTTTALLLRLPPEDALTLRTAARERGLAVSAFVARLLADPQRLEHARSEPATTSDLPLAEVSKLAGVLGLLPEEVRRARGELGRAFGLLKHFFELPTSAANAERHAFALAEATRDARAAIANVDAAAERLLDELAAIRDDLARTARRLARP